MNTAETNRIFTTETAAEPQFATAEHAAEEELPRVGNPFGGHVAALRAAFVAALDEDAMERVAQAGGASGRRKRGRRECRCFAPFAVRFGTLYLFALRIHRPAHAPEVGLGDGGTEIGQVAAAPVGRRSTPVLAAAG